MRWKYFIPAVVFVAICAVFSIFFLDSILKSAFIGGGEMVFGARVEIASVKTKFKNLSMDISGLKIANSSDVFKNLVEVDDIRFAVKPVPLLSKKVIIDEMAIDGVRWGTKRDTSGALPPRKAKKFAKKDAKENKDSALAKLFGTVKDKASAKASALPAANQLKDLQKQFSGISFDKAVSLSDLQSLKEMDNIKNSYNQKFAQYDTQLKSLNVNQEITKANSAIADISSIKVQSVQDIEPAKAKLNSFNSTKDELGNTVSQLQTMQSKLSTDIGSEKDLLDRINKLKDADYKALADKMKLPSFSFGNISDAIFGPVWLNRVHTVLYYMNAVRKYMPPKKKKQKAVNTRMKGSDISFPKEDNPPDFLISRILITGTTGGYGKEGEPLAFKGTITDITSDQAQLGRPTRLNITGAQGKRKLAIEGVLDHRTETPVDSLNIVYSGLPAKTLGVPDSEYLPDMNEASGNLSANFVLKGENVESNIEMKVSGFKTSSPTADETRKMILSLWADISDITVNAKLHGTFENLGFSVSSNIDRILSERMKNMLGAKFQEVQNKLRAEIDRQTNQKKDEIMGEFNGKKADIMKQFTDKQKEVQAKQDEIKSQIAQKENAGKDMLDSEKRKAQEQADLAKKQAQDAADLQKKQAQEAADREKKKAEDEANKKAEEKLKEMNPFK